MMMPGGMIVRTMIQRQGRVAWGLATLLALAAPWAPVRAEDSPRADVDDVMMSVVKEPDAGEQRFVGDIDLPAGAERARRTRPHEGEAPGRPGDEMETGPARAAEARQQGQDARRNAGARGRPDSGNRGHGKGQGPQN